MRRSLEWVLTYKRIRSAANTGHLDSYSLFYLMLRHLHVIYCQAILGPLCSIASIGTFYQIKLPKRQVVDEW